VSTVPRAVTEVRGVKVRPDGHVELPDRLATEEPLEIRVAGPGQEPRPVAVTMRTPGCDFELAAGFLLTEGLVRTEEIAGVGYCTTAEPEYRFNTVTVALRVPWDDGGLRRDFVATSSCGVCGKAGIDQVALDCPVLGPAPLVPATMIPLLPDRLRAAQHIFDRTGGLHAAGGAMPGATAVLCVSGRVSFEIVQKAAMAGLAVIAAVSAPSSLAVEAAERLGVTLAAFVRNGTYTLYSHPERIDLDA
jgi:FdhD protein